MTTYHPAQIAKALIAFLLSLATWGGTAMAPNSDGVSSIEPAEWFGLCGVLVAFLAVFAYPNRPAPGELPDDALSEQHVIPGDH